MSKESCCSLPQREYWQTSLLGNAPDAESSHLRGTLVAGMAWRPLNKSLEAGTAGSHFRIPDTHSAGGTTPGRPRELGQVALASGKSWDRSHTWGQPSSHLPGV